MQPITYRWRFKQAAIDPMATPSAKTRILLITNVTLASAGSYDVVVSDLMAEFTDNSATKYPQRFYRAVAP